MTDTRITPGALYDALTVKINRVRRRQSSVTLQAAALNALAAIIVTWAIALTLEAIAHFDVPGRQAIYWAAVAISGVSAAALIARPLARALGLIPPPSDDVIAVRVGSRIPEIGDHLVNTLQLYRTRSREAVALGYSPELVEASILRTAEPLLRFDYDVVVEREQRRRALWLFLGAVTLLAGLFSVAGDAYGAAFERLRNHEAVYNAPAPFTLSVAPGNVTIRRGDTARIAVTAGGVPPRTVTLHTRLEGQENFDAIELRPDADGVFRSMLAGVAVNTEYYVSSGTTRTDRYAVRVVDHPEIRLLQVTVAQPGRRTETLPDNAGDVAALRGSTVSVRVEVVAPIVRGSIVQLFPRAVASATGAPVSYDTVRIPMRTSGTAASGSFRLTRDGRYYVTVASADGLTNTSPIQYSMTARTDAPPTISLLQPTDSTTVDETMLLPTQVQIADDYGFSRLRLFYRLRASRFEEPWKAFRSIAIPLSTTDATSLEVPFLWNLTTLNVVPEDELEIYFEVADNDPSGAKTARTGLIPIRFPSLDEVLRQADQIQREMTAELEQVLQNAAEARKQMEEVHRELMRELAQSQGGSSWQQQQKVKELMQRHEQMEQALQNMAEDLRTMSERLQQAQAISPETLKKYEDLQKLFQEIKDPALRRAMEQMQDAMQQMTPQQIAEAMKNYKFNEEQFRASIERTMKILERMRTEQKMDEAVKRAEELVKQQEELNRRMREQQDAAGRKEMAERQKDLAKDAERLEQEMRELAERMMEAGEDMPNEELADALKEMAENDPQESMEDAASEMQQGDMQEAQQSGEQAKQRAENVSKRMQQARQKMREKSQQQVAQKMKKALQDLLELSRREEDLKRRTDAAQPNSGQFRDLAREQAQTKQDLENVTNQLAEMSQKTFSITPEMGKELGDAMRSMDEATRSLEQRDGQQASQQEGQAMGALNRAAMMLQNAIAQQQGEGQQGGGQGGGMQSFQQRLQELAAQQQMINMAMGQQAGGQGGQGEKGQGQQKGQGKEGEGEGEGAGRDGQQGSERARRLEQQQSGVKKSLDELNREVRESGGTRKNLAGDLERAAREIEEVLRDIRSGNVTSETRQRQDRILSRMLDAVRSVRERDYEKDRESRPGKDIVRSSPPDLNLPEPEQLDRARRDFLRGREAGYTKDFDAMIRLYFEEVRGGR